MRLQRDVAEILEREHAQVVGVAENPRHRHRHRREQRGRVDEGQRAVVEWRGVDRQDERLAVARQHAEVAPVGRVAGERHHARVAPRSVAIEIRRYDGRNRGSRTSIWSTTANVRSTSNLKQRDAVVNLRAIAGAGQSRRARASRVPGRESGRHRARPARCSPSSSAPAPTRAPGQTTVARRMPSDATSAPSSIDSDPRRCRRAPAPPQ